LNAAIENCRHVGARAAHVEAQCLTKAARGRYLRCADDPSRWSRQDACACVLSRGAQRENATRGLHHERLGKAGLPSPRQETAQVDPEARRQVGVGTGRRKPLELAKLGQDFARQRHVDMGQRRSNRRPHLALVLGMAEGKQEAYGHGIHLGVAQTADRLVQAGLLERLEHALRTHPLGDAEAQLARHKGGRTTARQLVQRGAALTAYLEHIAKPGGRHQRYAGTLSFEQRVRGDGRPVRERGDVGGLDARKSDRSHDSVGLVGRSGGDLDCADLTVHQRDEIGERTAHVHSYAGARHERDSPT